MTASSDRTHLYIRFTYTHTYTLSCIFLQLFILTHIPHLLFFTFLNKFKSENLYPAASVSFFPFCCQYYVACTDVIAILLWHFAGDSVIQFFRFFTAPRSTIFVIYIYIYIYQALFQVTNSTPNSQSQKFFFKESMYILLSQPVLGQARVKLYIILGRMFFRLVRSGLAMMYIYVYMTRFYSTLAAWRQRHSSMLPQNSLSASLPFFSLLISQFLVHCVIQDSAAFRMRPIDYDCNLTHMYT